MFRGWRWGGMLLGLLLPGCAHYAPQPLDPAATTAQLDSRRLDDPGLKQFLEQNLGTHLDRWPPQPWELPELTLVAFYYQPRLEVARAEWQATAAEVKTAGGRPNPTIAVTPGYDTTTAIPSPWFPAVNFDVPLETAGKRSKRIAAAQQRSAAARWQVIETAWQVRSQVRGSLLEVTVAEQRAGLLQLQVQTQQQLVHRLQQRLEAGAISRPELTTAQTALQHSEADLADARMRVAEARPRLAAALGLSTPALAGAEFGFEFPEPEPALTSAAARRMALQSRADILAALADYAAAEADLRLEIARQYPDIHLNPGYQYDQGDNKWSLGLTVELPLLNRNEGPIATATARRQLAAAKFTALQAQVIGDIDTAVAGWQAARASQKNIAALVAAAQKQLRAVTAQKRAGAADQLDVLAAQAEANNAALTQLDYEAQYQAKVGALEDALQRPADALAAALAAALAGTPEAPNRTPSKP